MEMYFNTVTGNEKMKGSLHTSSIQSMIMPMLSLTTKKILSNAKGLKKINLINSCA